MLECDDLCTPFAASNECTSGTHNCHSNATCTNTVGSFICACVAGYSGNGVMCTGKLINECSSYFLFFLLSHVIFSNFPCCLQTIKTFGKEIT